MRIGHEATDHKTAGPQDNGPHERRQMADFRLCHSAYCRIERNWLEMNSTYLFMGSLAPEKAALKA